MHLDMLTMSVASIAVTAALGLVLVFTWVRERQCAFVGWWGLALIVTSAAIVAGVASSAKSATTLLSFANVLLVLGEAVKWRATRAFSRRPVGLAWVLVGPACFLLAVHSGYLSTFGGRLILLCSLLAIYNFAAAFELSRADGAQLVSRWPAVVLLVVTGLGFLSWMPLVGTGALVRPRSLQGDHDGYGHEAGDVVLKLFARKLSERLDGETIVARLGGEEFAAVLPGAGPEQALVAGEDVRRAFANSAAFINGVALGATVSVGAASAVAFDSDLGGLFRRADAALYAAKRAGRNRVEMLEPDSAGALEALKSKVRAANRERPVPLEPRAFKKSA